MEATSAAIWSRNVVAVLIASTIWVINGAFVIQASLYKGVSQQLLSGAQRPGQIIVSFVTEARSVLTVIVMGVIWLLHVTGVVPTVFVCINLDVFVVYRNTDFGMPWIITMLIAASRMYRGLNDFLYSGTTYDNHVFPLLYAHCTKISILAHTISTGVWGTPVMPVQLDEIGVDVRTAHKSQPLPDVTGNPTYPR
ncbi:hypothetical protein DFH94DRAFT_797786 [Russula ochroleuca]|uniref:Uncharacterized protein n=1 Tax=Russula ochroleuca TaxID=152965 RepID=A0A9P5TE08_9AGAM|nr:hypothetical protein DFH94DRAFT_797786 [Russula ochroleuca]